MPPRVLQLVRSRDARDIALVVLADALVGLSFGAIATGGGLPLWLPVVTSLFVFAGGSQFAFAGVLLAGGDPFTAALAGIVLNARLLAFGFAAADALGVRPPIRLLGAHLLTDESLAFTLRSSDPARRRRLFWTTGVSLFVAWNISVAVGGLLGGVIGDTDALGLDAAFPAVLVALVIPALRRWDLRGAAVLGAALACAATPVLPAGLPVLVSLAGLVLVLRGRLGPRDPLDLGAPSGRLP